MGSMLRNLNLYKLSKFGYGISVFSSCYQIADFIPYLILFSFRFLLSPFTNATEACLYDPDVIVPWQFISCVVQPKQLKAFGHSSSEDVPRAPSHEQDWGLGSSPVITSADFESVDDLSMSQVCPICLDEVQVPRITSCGHTFW